MTLTHAVVIITGASRGLGRALALAFHQAGARVIATDYALENFQSADLPSEIAQWPLDVTDQPAVADAARRVVDEYGRLDVWVNNAGVWTPHRPFETVPLEEFRRLIEVDYLGTLYGSRAAYEAMLPRRAGAIINVLSIRVRENQPGTAAYAAAKGAAWQLTTTVRLEAAEHGLHIIGVYPPRMKTRLFDDQPPPDYDAYLEPAAVASEIVKNVERDQPILDLLITS